MLSLCKVHAYVALPLHAAIVGQDFSKTSAWTISKIEAFQAIRVVRYPCVAHCVHHMQQAGPRLAE